MYQLLFLMPLRIDIEILKWFQSIFLVIIAPVSRLHPLWCLHWKQILDVPVPVFGLLCLVLILIVLNSSVKFNFVNGFSPEIVTFAAIRIDNTHVDCIDFYLINFNSKNKVIWFTCMFQICNQIYRILIFCHTQGV